jgi:hypothetical protein
MHRSPLNKLKATWVFALLGIALCTSCSTPARQASQSVVRKLNQGTTPRPQTLAENARKTADSTYPAIRGLLANGDSTAPRQFDIVFKPNLRSGRLAETRLDQIYVNKQYLQQFEDERGVFEEVLVHEMTHVAQHYYRRIIGRWLVADPRPPVYWVEGIADYVCFKLGFTNGTQCAECNSVFPSYTDGYSCAGAFLLYLERTYNPSIVPQLNSILRAGRYSDDFFFQTTGKDLPKLWAEFHQTSAFTAGAVRMLQLREKLGFVNGKAPKDIQQRLDSYLKEHGDTRTKKLMGWTHVPTLPNGEVQTRLTIIYYLTQPGGPAEAFMTNLQEQQQLPGFLKGEHGTLNSFLGARDLNATFPATRSFTASKQGEPSTYHYTVYRASEEDSWKMLRAWRTIPDGDSEELPVR